MLYKNLLIYICNGIFEYSFPSATWRHSFNLHLCPLLQLSQRYYGGYRQRALIRALRKTSLKRKSLQEV